MTTRTAVFLLLAAGLVTPSAAKLPEFRIIEADPFGVARDVSADGTVVVGSARSDNASPGDHEALRWTGATGTVYLGDLPGGDYRSYATAVSGDGTVVVGGSEDGGGNVDHPFRWTAATGMQDLGVLSSGEPAYGQAWDISADGSVIVGSFTMHTPSYHHEAYRWTAGAGFQPLGDLPGGGLGSTAFGISADGSTVVGYGTTAAGMEPFRWTAPTAMQYLGDLPGGSVTFGRARAASADGSVVVGMAVSANGEEAFRWTAQDRMVPLGDLPGGFYQSEALAVSADGSTVFGQSITSWGWEAFIWDAQHGMRNLRDVLINEYNLPVETHLAAANAVSQDGLTIVGSTRFDPWMVRLPDPPVNDPEGLRPGRRGWGVLEVVNNGTMASIADARRSLEDGGGDRLVYNLTGPLNLSDPQRDAGHFPGDRPYGVADAHGQEGDPWPEPGQVHHIALLARGQAWVPETGDWTFYTRSDDGDELAVDDHRFVIGSEQWGRTSLGTVYLEKGLHDLQVIHRQGAGPGALEVGAARGVKSVLDGSFRPIGGPAEPAFTVRVPGLAGSVTIDQTVPLEEGSIENLAEAQNALNTQPLYTTDDATFLSHSDHQAPGERGFLPEEDLPYERAWQEHEDNDEFAVRATGLLHITNPGAYYIGYNSDDGAQLQILGAVWEAIVEDATGAAVLNGNTMATDALTAWSWTVGRVTLDEGSYPFELISFEHRGGAFVELFGSDTLGVYDLLEVGPGKVIDVAGPLQLVPEPGTLALLALGALALLRRLRK